VLRRGLVAPAQRAKPAYRPSRSRRGAPSSRPPSWSRSWWSWCEPGEPVWISEKIHGANARYTFDGETLHVGSRTSWKKQNEKSIWWKAVAVHPEIEAFCRAHVGWTLYGEVYGQVQDLKYGVKGVRFAAFDLLCGDEWQRPAVVHALCRQHGVPTVPVVAGDPRFGFSFDLDAVLALAEGPSLVPGADHVREGVVVRPLGERTHPAIGRVMLKIVGNGYLERA